MSETGGSKECVADKVARLAQLRESGALTDKEFQRLKAKCLGIPRLLFPVALVFLAVLLAVFALYFLLPWFRGHVPAMLGPLPSGVVWFGAIGAEMSSLYGIFVHNEDWNHSYNYWHYCRPLFGAVTGSVGALFYLVLLHLGGTTIGKIDTTTFYVIAFVLGFADRAFMQMLDNVTAIIVKPGQRGGSVTSPDPCPPSPAHPPGPPPGPPVSGSPAEDGTPSTGSDFSP